jgi:hypothetical protein
LAEWLTPVAIFAALNTNKELKKKRRKIHFLHVSSFSLVNGGLMALFAVDGL